MQPAWRWQGLLNRDDNNNNDPLTMLPSYHVSDEVESTLDVFGSVLVHCNLDGEWEYLGASSLVVRSL